MNDSEALQFGVMSIEQDHHSSNTLVAHWSILLIINKTQYFRMLDTACTKVDTDYVQQNALFSGSRYSFY